VGNLGKHPIENWRKEYKLDTLIETGTYQGAGIRTALRFGFQKVYSIELNKRFYDRAVHEFQDDPVVLVLGDSITEIGKIAKLLKEDNILFWLDAHLPSITGYKKEHSDDTKFPLEIELSEIAKNRDVSNDVFLIDDLRIYEKAKYGRGNLRKEDWKHMKGNIDFIFDVLRDTHDINRDLRDEGYVVCLPKSKQSN
jgi:hypothetical protein